MNTKHSKTLIVIIRLIIIIAVIGGALLIAKKLLDTAPRNPTRPKRERMAIAHTETLEISDKQIFLNTTGIITYESKLNIHPQVTGKITKLSDSFIPGFYIKQGETIAEIDDADYKIALTEAQANLTEAQYKYNIEQGYQSVSKHEWELFDEKENLDKLEKELMLRKPHLQLAEAKLKAAEANVEKAKLNLERTKIKAPFNGIIVSKDVALGSLVSSQTLIGSAISADCLWAKATLPLNELKWLRTAGSGSPATAYISLSGSAENDAQWEGIVEDVMTEVETNGRKANVLIKIPDPMSQQIPLLINTFVNVEIEGPVLKNVFVVPATAIHSGNKLWIKNSKKRLEIKEVEIVWQNSTSAIIEGDDIQAGDLIVTSSISSPVPGMRLTTREEMDQMQKQNGNKMGARTEGGSHAEK